MEVEQLNSKVLGQLLLMQSVVINLPDNKSIFSFVCQGLRDIPGINRVDYISERIDQNANSPEHIYFSIDLGDSHFGELLIQISDLNRFKPYENYIKNFVFMIGVILEERYQRHLNEQHKLELEQKIRERTFELTLEKENLAESQRRFNDMMANINLLSLMIDSNGNIIFCNNYLLKISGYTATEVMNKNFFDLFLSKPLIEKEKELFRQFVAGDKVSVNFENELLTKNGEKLIISWNSTILYDIGKQVFGTASIGEDITQRKKDELLLKEKTEEIEAQNEEYIQINEELYLAKEKAEKSDRLKTSFLQNMSHEIRTPMNAIMGFSELLEHNFENREKLLKFTKIIVQRSHDLLEIINDVLDISRIESGHLETNYEKFSVEDLFDDLCSLFSDYQRRYNKQHILLKFSNKNSGSTDYVISDKTKVKQIFINLITNAFKFTDNGAIEIGYKYDTNGNFIFRVADTGIGIPPDKQNYIFERFAQIKHDSKMNIGGTGLGLPIVKGLLELLGGAISIESKPDKGSTFSFIIPNRTLNQENIVQKTNSKENKPDLKNKTVLIVEDDTYNLEYLKEILSDAGVNILQAINGQEAIDITLKENIDIVLMDIRLPDTNGYEVTREILRHKPMLKIIAQTAYASNEDIQNAKNAGCSDYISKPTNKDLLLYMLTNNI